MECRHFISNTYICLGKDRLIYIVDPHTQRAWDTKLRGLLERLSGKCGVFLTRESELSVFDRWCNSESIRVTRVISNILKLSKDDALLLDSRAKLTQEHLVALENDTVRIILSANHFFVPEKIILELIRKAAGRLNLTIVVENLASVPHVLDCWGIPNLSPDILLVPPVLDSKRDFQRFSLVDDSFDWGNRLIDRRVLHAGAIVYHRPRNRWWQEKFRVLEYCPARTMVNSNSKNLEITDLSKVIEDNSRRDQWGNKIRRRLEIILGIQKKRYDAYYSVNLPREFKNHLFFICPEDIFEVVPQIGFQAMRSGMILIGSSTKAYESLGFSDCVNYLSVGETWSLASLEKVLGKIKELDITAIEAMLNCSQILLAEIESAAIETLEGLCKKQEFRE